MPSAAPGDAPAGDLAALRDEPLQAPDVLVVHDAQLVDTEFADLPATESAPLRGLACWWNGSLLPRSEIEPKTRARCLEGDLVVPFAVRLDGFGHGVCPSARLSPPHELHPLRNHLDDIALLAVLRLPVPGLESPFDHHGASLVQVLTTALRLLSPHHHRKEAGLLTLLSALGRVVAVHGQPQVGHRRAARRIAQLGGTRQVADEEHLVQARHQTTSSTAATGAGGCFGTDRTRFFGGTRVERKRRTCSFKPSCRSNSLITAGTAEHSMTAYVPSRCLRMS